MSILQTERPRHMDDPKKRGGYVKVVPIPWNKFHLYRVFFFFTGPPLTKTKSKILLEYPDWASPGPPKKVKYTDWASPKASQVFLNHRF